MSGSIEGWDFADEAANGTRGLIHRQKSADDLVLLALDEKARAGVFLDREKQLLSAASLSACDCHDFMFVGK